MVSKYIILFDLKLGFKSQCFYFNHTIQHQGFQEFTISQLIKQFSSSDKAKIALKIDIRFLVAYVSYILTFLIPL